MLLHFDARKATTPNQISTLPCIPSLPLANLCLTQTQKGRIMGWGSADYQAGATHAKGLEAAEAVGRSVAEHGIMGHLFPGLRKQAAPASDMKSGHAGVKAEALRELARYNPNHPLLNKSYRSRLFDKYASGKLQVPTIGEYPLAQDPEVK
jgi:hypothetical protein